MSPTHLLQQLLYYGYTGLQLVAIVAKELDDLAHHIVVLLALHIVPIQRVHLLLRPGAARTREKWGLSLLLD